MNSKKQLQKLHLRNTAHLTAGLRYLCIYHLGDASNLGSSQKSTRHRRINLKIHMKINDHMRQVVYYSEPYVDLSVFVCSRAPKSHSQK